MKRTSSLAMTPATLLAAAVLFSCGHYGNIVEQQFDFSVAYSTLTAKRQTFSHDRQMGKQWRRLLAMATHLMHLHAMAHTVAKAETLETFTKTTRLENYQIAFSPFKTLRAALINLPPPAV